jgi:purine-nucleoside/S-methyl-5'-thioadenosine phosphorylase / adenosine deaminase
MTTASPVLLPDWPAPPGVRAVVTTRLQPGTPAAVEGPFDLGPRDGHDPAAVARNRATLLRAQELPAPPCWLRQVHGTGVFDADAARAPAGAEPEADAAVTRAANVVLAILTADCLPVLLCADDGSVVAAAHAGWRGLAGGVVESAVAALGVTPERVLAWLGPCIGAASYEVGADVRNAFVREDAGAGAAFVPTRPGHWLCDLVALARRRLARAGVTRVQGGGFDTFTDPRFPSYRRDGRTGRFASLIWRDPRG